MVMQREYMQEVMADCFRFCLRGDDLKADECNVSLRSDDLKANEYNIKIVAEGRYKAPAKLEEGAEAAAPAANINEDMILVADVSGEVEIVDGPAETNG